MGITGRYSFPGIQKAVGASIDAIIAGTGWGAWILASPFKPVIAVLRTMIINFLVNHGLIIINVGANIIGGVLDQRALDDEIDAGIQKVMQGRNLLTPAQGKAIDDEVRKAFDADADVDASDSAPDSMSAVPATSFRAGNHTSI